MYLDKNGGRTEMSFDFLDIMDYPIKKIESSIRRLGKDGLLKINTDYSGIIDIELTPKAQGFLSEHIVRKIVKKR
jgi:hypothetical protein